MEVRSAAQACFPDRPPPQLADEVRREVAKILAAQTEAFVAAATEACLEQVWLWLAGSKTGPVASSPAAAAVASSPAAVALVLPEEAASPSCPRPSAAAACDADWDPELSSPGSLASPALAALRVPGAHPAARAWSSCVSPSACAHVADSPGAGDLGPALAEADSTRSAPTNSESGTDQAASRLWPAAAPTEGLRPESGVARRGSDFPADGVDQGALSFPQHWGTKESAPESAMPCAEQELEALRQTMLAIAQHVEQLSPAREAPTITAATRGGAAPDLTRQSSSSQAAVDAARPPQRRSTSLDDAELQEEKGLDIRWTIHVDRSSGQALGLDVRRNEERLGMLEVKQVRDTGLVAIWNRENPAQAVQLGDFIFQANGSKERDGMLSAMKRMKPLDISMCRKVTETIQPRGNDRVCFELLQLEKVLEATMSEASRLSADRDGCQERAAVIPTAVFPTVVASC